MNTPKAYLGKDKYIFISYSHRDNASVMPFIAELQKKYNVWFDEGIEFGREWEDEIAARLLGCELFIFMVSDNSLASTNCKDEIHMAREKGKQFINVMTHKTNLPDSFTLRYARYQTCFLYNYPSLDLAVADMEKKCERFKNCLADHAKAAPVAQAPVAPSPAPASKPAPQAKPAATPAAQPAATPNPAEGEAEKPKKKNFFKDVLVKDKFAFIMLIVSTLFVIVNMSEFGSGTTYSGKNLTVLSIFGFLFAAGAAGMQALLIFRREKLQKKAKMAIRIIGIASLLISLIFVIIVAAR